MSKQEHGWPDFHWFFVRCWRGSLGQEKCEAQVSWESGEKRKDPPLLEELMKNNTSV